MIYNDLVRFGTFCESSFRNDKKLLDIKMFNYLKSIMCLGREMSDVRVDTGKGKLLLLNVNFHKNRSGNSQEMIII